MSRISVFRTQTLAGPRYKSDKTFSAAFVCEKPLIYFTYTSATDIVSLSITNIKSKQIKNLLL